MQQDAKSTAGVLVDVISRDCHDSAARRREGKDDLNRLNFAHTANTLTLFYIKPGP